MGVFSCSFRATPELAQSGAGDSAFPPSDTGACRVWRWSRSCSLRETTGLAECGAEVGAVPSERHRDLKSLALESELFPPRDTGTCRVWRWSRSLCPRGTGTCRICCGTHNCYLRDPRPSSAITAPAASVCKENSYTQSSAELDAMSKFTRPAKNKQTNNEERQPKTAYLEERLTVIELLRKTKKYRNNRRHN